MTQVEVYIDEAGSLPDPNSRYVVIAAVVTTHAQSLQRIIRKAGRKIKKSGYKKHRTREIKWYNTTNLIRSRVLQMLAAQDVELFWVVIDKEGVGVPDTPYNYGLMVGELVEECLAYHPNLSLFVDWHFNLAKQRDDFNRLLFELFKVPQTPVHLDSQTNAVIQLADFVAGAFLYQMTGKVDWSSMIEGKVVVGKVVKWKHLKQKTGETPGSILPD